MSAVYLSQELRSLLESTVIKGRVAAETGADCALRTSDLRASRTSA